MIIIITIPEHIGIIPDGNRRLARRLMSKPWKGHEWGLDKIRDLLNWCKEYDVHVVSVYVLSLENFNSRPKRELNYLFNLARKEIHDIINEKDHVVHKNNVKVNFFGKLDVLPEDLKKGIETVSELTKDYSDFYLNMAIAYGGRQEIVNASKNIAYDIRKGVIKPENINESLLRKYFWTNGFKDPDLIIRTGGEKRLSNFLPFQSTYSELVFLDTFWPEMKKEDFARSIKEFSERQRRFGK